VSRCIRPIGQPAREVVANDHVAKGIRAAGSRLPGYPPSWQTAFRGTAMPQETRDSHVARLRELGDVARTRKLNSTELWEVSRRCAEIGDLTKAQQAAERAKALDELTEQARRAESGASRPEPAASAPRPAPTLPPIGRQLRDQPPPLQQQTVYRGPTTSDIATGSCCGIIMAPIALVVLAFLALMFLLALGSAQK